MNTTGMPALREATSHFNYLRTADPAAGILAAQKAGMPGGKVYVGHLWDPAADEQGALCKEPERRLHPPATKCNPCCYPGSSHRS